MKEKIKLSLKGLYLEKEGIKSSYCLNGKKIFVIDIPRLMGRISVVICTAKKLNVLKIEESICNLKKLPFLFDIVIVVGRKRDIEIMKSKFREEYIKVILNEDFKDTVYTSLKMGIRAINPETSFIILLFGNQEPLETSTYFRIFENIFSSKNKIFIPVYKNERGHPIIFSSLILKDLLALRKEKGIPYLLRKFKYQTEEMDLNDKKILSMII
jgi:molybdenum cofactor cytidylyltransferase